MVPGTEKRVPGRTYWFSHNTEAHFARDGTGAFQLTAEREAQQPGRLAGE
jgi:hypothetical protein